ncbi:MinD/ParA family protein [Desulfoferrobacter suflitae]|uniref:MinD/ParA family protein n=1 Tax=Desulfoferrobacter suflitae TaxID=2865782 RepID=UPI0021641BA6|nr:MinD/ParA family protein [Desulfoferrobacter suflitae]MCK8602422.1 MinD/ParA family protein [Desulfoferrobacter suflitae]
MDQAAGLRDKEFNKRNPTFYRNLGVPKRQVRVIAVSSGKGGVGKSTVVINLAVAFDRMGQRVLVLDADLGLANIDIFLGLTPKQNISHVLNGKRQLHEVLVNGPGRIRIMPASSGVQELTRLTDEQKLLLLEMLDELESEVDLLLIDTAAGISDTVLYFNLAAQERIIVVTPEPTSLTDAYALIKVLHTRNGERHFRILTNAADSDREGKLIFAKLSKVADHFLNGISLDYLGNIPRDPQVSAALLQQKPFITLFPHTAAAKAFVNLADRIHRSAPARDNGNVRFFWKRFLEI